MTDVLAETPIEEIEYGKLRLDPENPRLLKFVLQEGPLDDEAMVSALLSRFDPEPVGRSIVDNGFFSTEPLIVFPEGNHFIVAEGNRRLVALKLLREPHLREAVDADEVWDELAAELEANPQRLARLESIPCQKVPDREAAAPIIGYRHIVGVLKWDAFEKAAYVVGLLKGGPAQSFEEVAELAGVKPPRIKRYLRDWLAIEQAKSAGIDVLRAQEEFGRWERAMHAKGVREYVQAVSPKDLEPDSERAYEADDEQMEKLISFLYGEPGGPDRLFTDTRRIDDFSTALQSEDGRRILEEERDLESAFEAAGGRREFVLKSLAKALTALQQARGDYSDYAEDEEIVASVDAIGEELVRLQEGVTIAEQAAEEPQGDFELDEDEQEEFETAEEDEDEEGAS